jgi:hypothetical protein
MHPEDLLPAGAAVAEEAGGTSTIPVSIEVIEYHGRTVEAIARMGDDQDLRITTDQPLTRGERLDLAIRADRVLVYQGESPEELEQLEALAEQIA